jgi:hypothetical protein
MKEFLQDLQYPHWMIAAGGLLVLLGFIGFAFQRTRAGEPNRAPAGPTDG